MTVKLIIVVYSSFFSTYFTAVILVDNYDGDKACMGSFQNIWRLLEIKKNQVFP
jgi:hypothetical protein